MQRRWRSRVCDTRRAAAEIVSCAAIPRRLRHRQARTLTFVAASAPTILVNNPAANGRLDVPPSARWYRTRRVLGSSSGDRTPSGSPHAKIGTMQSPAVSADACKNVVGATFDGLFHGHESTIHTCSSVLLDRRTRRGSVQWKLRSPQLKNQRGRRAHGRPIARPMPAFPLTTPRPTPRRPPRRRPRRRPAPRRARRASSGTPASPPSSAPPRSRRPSRPRPRA